MVARALAVVIKVETIVEIRAVAPKEVCSLAVSKRKRTFLKRVQEHQVVAEVTLEVVTGAVEANDRRILKIKNVLFTQNVFYLKQFFLNKVLEIQRHKNQLSVFALYIHAGLKPRIH